jgi:hypothetical protein
MTHTIRLEVEGLPLEVDAAAEFSLKARVSCIPALDLRGQMLSIRNQDGVEIGSVELVEFDGEINATDALVLKAPASLGTYSWSVVCPAGATGDIMYGETTVPFLVTVKPHKSRIVVWDVPSAVVVNEKFHVKVGLKCSGACRLEGRAFAILDSDGMQVSAGTVGGDPWPGSTALYFGEVEIEAPPTEGYLHWQVKVPASGADEECIESFGTSIVPSPEFLVSVEVIDKLAGTPLGGASIAMYPYRAVTDDRGVATIRVARGQYNLQVSQPMHLAMGVCVVVTQDVTTRVELDPQPETNEDLRYI